MKLRRGEEVRERWGRVQASRTGLNTALDCRLLGLLPLLGMNLEARTSRTPRSAAVEVPTARVSSAVLAAVTVSPEMVVCVAAESSDVHGMLKARTMRRLSPRSRASSSLQYPAPQHTETRTRGVSPHRRQCRGNLGEPHS